MTSTNSLRVALLVAAVIGLTTTGTGTDSTRAKVAGPGYGGVLPVPDIDATDDLPLDVLALHRTDAAPAPGRVLYAGSRSSKQTDRASARTRARVCPPQQAVVQRAAGPAPNT